MLSSSQAAINANVQIISKRSLNCWCLLACRCGHYLTFGRIVIQLFLGDLYQLDAGSKAVARVGERH
ncbi:unnamed protein product [Schistosoma intercalatum]|nr:unnamed protein product [Schistosoma intercalatum]